MSDVEALANVNRSILPLPAVMTSDDYRILQNYIRVLIAAYLGTPLLEANCRTGVVRVYHAIP